MLRPMRSKGIYVEARMRGSLDEIWRKTQDPALHQRWDLRFSTIGYLPRLEGEPQRFLYETRIGLGLAIRGRGESAGERKSETERSSALRFWSDDWRALIAEGKGYWKYIETSEGVLFLTWYDYRTRYGHVGAVIDYVLFRPLMGWATAWSFDRLRLWVEREAAPELTLRCTAVYAIARLGVIAIWLWQGLVPKLLFADADELHLLTASGLSSSFLPWIGFIEMLLGLGGFFVWRWRGYFRITALLMLAALCSVIGAAPAYFHHAFNPLSLNLAMLALCATGCLPFRGVCRAMLKTRPKE